jgi:curved DNA-binding protein CbpA
MRDPYESLAVSRSATAADIKKSFRDLAKRLHPDANSNDPKAAALFAELNAAHEILGDEEKRRAFDHGEIDAEGKPTRRAIARPSKPSMSHIVTSLMVVMVMLFITATLIMRDLSPGENITATDAGGDGVLSAIEPKEEHAPAAQPEQAAPSVQSTPRLILRQSVSHAGAGDSVPLGIQVSRQADGLALEISGLPSGTKISSGRELGGGGWRILAADVGNAAIKPPPGFSGTIDLVVALRLIDDTLVDRGSLHFGWLQKPMVAAERIESVDAPAGSENSADKALPTPPPTDQKAVQDTTDSHPDHEPIDVLIGKSEKPAVAAERIESVHASPAAENSADKALPTPPPTNQKAAQVATDSHPDREAIDLLIERSEKLIATGDVEAARSLLQPAAEAHDARAALALGATYDPIMLAILQGRGVIADVSLALDWYKKAQEFGSPEAQGRLKLLSSRLAEPKRHVFHRPPPVVHAPKQAETPPADPYGVYVAGTRVGSDPDPNIRSQLLRDDAGRQLRTTPRGAAEAPK